MRRLAILAALFLSIASPAPAEKPDYPGDVTATCRIRASFGEENRKKLFDRNYATYCSVNHGRPQEILISLPGGSPASGLYLCFAREPARIALYLGDQQAPQAEAGADGIPHKYLPFSGEGDIRLVITGDAGGFALSELFVTAGAEPPPWVQRWAPPLERADLLVLVAHPDDELLWMGGALPYYAAGRGMDVAVAYMTGSNYLRRSEGLNGLWAADIRHYPHVAGFKDRRAEGARGTMALWGGEEKAVGYVTALIRRLRPRVMLSHDLNGEYGHPAHKATAQAAVTAAENAHRSDFHPDSAGAYGLWRPLKLYLHLYPEDRILMDWETPLASLGGRSPLDVAADAFRMHASQKNNWRIEATGPLSASDFGLFQSLVGEDRHQDDFFENVPGYDPPPAAAP